MSPKLNCLLAIILIAGAGIPLFHLSTKSIQKTPAAVLHEDVEEEKVQADLRFTGKPKSISIWHEGRLLAHILEPHSGPWTGDLRIPTEAKRLELEVEICWPEGQAEQAATLKLESSSRPELSTTAWSQGETLHDILLFVW